MRRELSLLTIICPILATATSAPADAAVSAWTKAEGAQIRLLVDPAGAASGTMWGAVQISLAPGWKTYWENPGDSGVPPKLDLSDSANVAGAKLLFPAPERHSDHGLTWTGYEQPVSLPVTLSLKQADKPIQVKGSIFLGICKDICVPVEAHFDVPVGAGEQDVLAHTIVGAARAALPKPASGDFGLVSAMRADHQLILKARVPNPGKPADLFVSGGEALILGTPATSGDNSTFLVPVTGGSNEKDGAAVPLSYTLVQDGEARSGEIVAR